MKTSKRILCMLLAIIMTLSMGTIALADNNIYASSMRLNKSSVSMYAGGDTQTLIATVNPTDYNGNYTWTSSNEEVVTITSNGKSATLTPVAAGNATVTLKVDAEPTDSTPAYIEKTCTVTVSHDGVASVKIYHDAAEVTGGTVFINEDGNADLIAKIVTESGDEKTVSYPNAVWRTADDEIAHYTTGGTISYGKTGITTATVTASGAGSSSGSATVTIVCGLPEEDEVTINGPTGNVMGLETKHTFTADLASSVSNFAKYITWSCSRGSIDANTGAYTAPTSAHSSVKIYAKINNNTIATYTMKVQEIYATEIVLDDSEITMSIGSEEKLGYTLTPENASGYTITWDVSSGDNYVSVSPDGTVKAKAAGTAVVTATLKNADDSEVTDLCIVNVKNAVYDTGVTADVGANKSLNLASTIASYFKIRTGCSSNPNTITIDSIYGEDTRLLYKNSSGTATSNYVTEASYNYSAFASFYLRPTKAGTYYVDYTASNGNYKMTGTITIKVGANNKDIELILDSAREDYEFTSDANSEETAAYLLISDVIGVTYDSIKFESSDYSSFDDIGDLYINATSSKKVESYSYSYTTSRTGSYPIRELCFKPNGEAGTYAIDYTAYSGSDVVATGTLYIIVDEAASDEVTVTLDNDDDTYYFDDDTEKEDDSAYNMIYDMIEDVFEDEYYSDTGELYIEFYTIDDDDAGILYDDDEDEVEEGDAYELYDLYDFSFEPVGDGAYVAELDIYDDSDMSKSDYVGTIFLKIVVGGSDDMTLTLDNDDPYTFSDKTDDDNISAYNLIKNYLEDATSKNCYYIRFTKVESGSDVGKLYLSDATNAKAVTIGSSGTTLFLSSSSSSNSLYDVTFEPSKAGEYKVQFSAYTSTSSLATTGTLTLVVPGSSSYEADGDVVVWLDEDVGEYYFTEEDDEGEVAYDLIIDYVYDEFDIDLESEGHFEFYKIDDDAGTLYLNDDKKSIELEEAYDDKDLEDLYFLTDKVGVYEAEIDIYDDDKTWVDSFIFQIVVGDPNSVVELSKTITTYSNGYTFKAGDFYSLLDKDPIMSVQFAQPKSGKLYIGYANGSGTLCASTNKFYTATSNYGTYAINKLTYIPKAGFSGNVAIEYLATTKGGKVIDGTITMSVKTKTASGKFSDVTASNVGTWAADSIDFASSWGLVNGTTTTAPFKFDPYANMRRCDLLLILYRAAGSPAVTGSTSHTDISGTYAYAKNAMIWAYKNGIVTNIVTSAYTFAPATAVTREEFATILYNYTKYTGVSVTNTGSLANYKDASSVSSYAKSAMTWAVAKGYITSMSTTELVLSPKTQATRAQIATLLHRYLTY